MSPSETSSLLSVKQGSVDSSKVLSDILVLPEAKVSKKRPREPACAKCLTNDSVLEEMKSKVKEKEEKKRTMALEREEKRRLKLGREQKKKTTKGRTEAEKADVQGKNKRRENESVDDLVSNLSETK